MKEEFTDGAFAVGWSVVRKLPESTARSLFDFGAGIAWRRQGHGVQVLEGNLTRVVPDADGKELRELSREALRSYARYYCESFRLQDIPKERIDDEMHVNRDQVDKALEYMKNGRGVIFALPHMGNFEQAGAWVVNYGAGSITTVAERLKPESVYQRFLKFRESLGMEVLPLTGGASSSFGILAQRLRAGSLVCLVTDRDLSATGVEVTFFGEAAKISAGSAALAVQTGAALMPVGCWFQGETGWGAHVYDEIPMPETGGRREKVAAMTQALATAFETPIREHPTDWHMLQRVFLRDLRDPT
jgi:phosphatidylinositol dimannoside acyltransferase